MYLEMPVDQMRGTGARAVTSCSFRLGFDLARVSGQAVVVVAGEVEACVSLMKSDGLATGLACAAPGRARQGMMASCQAACYPSTVAS